MMRTLIILTVCLGAAVSPAASAVETDDTIPIREEVFRADTPHPDAWSNWPGTAGECVYSVGGPAYRMEEPSDWTLPAVFDLVQGLGVSDVFFIPRVAPAQRVWRAPAAAHPLPVVLSPELDTALELARERNQRVWVFLNWNEPGLDFTSRRYRQTIHNLLDALAAKKREHPHLVGTWLDEIWCGMGFNDYAGKLDAFRDFCRAEFNEEYSGDAMPCQADPANKWWRRYVMFKYCIYESFIKDYTEYSSRLGLQTIPFLVNPHRYSRGWRWGHDRYRQSKYGDFISSPTYYKNPFPVENSIMHLQPAAGFAFTQALRGLPVQHYVSDYYRNNSEGALKSREIFDLARAWRQARPCEEVAFLTYPPAVMGLFTKGEKVFAENDECIQQSLGSRFAVRMVDVRETRFFNQYRVLITGRYSAYSVPAYALEGLRRFVEQGGVLLAFDTDFAEGRRDLTDPAPRTAALIGAELGEPRALSGAVRFAAGSASLTLAEGTAAPVLAPQPGAVPIAFAGDTPVGFERQLGQGRVVSLYVDLARQMASNRAAWTEALAGVVRRYHEPAVQCTGALSVQGVIRKENRALISLFTGAGPRIDISARPFEVPFAAENVTNVQGTVRIHPDKLGLPDARYQVFSLATYRTIPGPDGASTWTPAELQEGIPATVTREMGFENLVIEPPGTRHDSNFVQELQAAEQAREALLEKARANPPIAYDPLRARVAVSPGGPAPSGIPFPAAGRGLLLAIAAPADPSGRREPVNLPAAKLLETWKGPAPAIDRLALWQRTDDAWVSMPLQVNAWTDAGRGARRPEAGALAPGDDLVFAARLAAGTNLFFLAAGAGSGAAPAAPDDGLDVQADPAGVAIRTVWNRIALMTGGEMRIGPAAGTNDYLRMELFGTRFLNLWKSARPWDLAATGAVEVIARRQLTGPARGLAGTVTLSAEFRAYAGSPYVYFRLASDQDGSFYHIQWPKGWIDLGAGKRSNVRFLTERGWTAPGFAFQVFRDGYKTAVRYGEDGTPPGFGLLVASSTFPRPHSWLCESHGLFWVQPASHHCATERLRNPAAEYLLIEGVTDPVELDREADRWRTPLAVTVMPAGLN